MSPVPLEIYRLAHLSCRAVYAQFVQAPRKNTDRPKFAFWLLPFFAGTANPNTGWLGWQPATTFPEITANFSWCAFRSSAAAGPQQITALIEQEPQIQISSSDSERTGSQLLRRANLFGACRWE